MTQIKATELRKGAAITLEKTIYIVTDFQHVTRGNWRGYIQVRLRNVVDGRSHDRRLRSTDRVEMTYIDRKELQYLYAEPQARVFMDNQSYEQYSFPDDSLGDNVKFLLPNINVVGEFYNDKLVNIVLPASVEMTITETEPVLKDVTATSVLKPAVSETGLCLRVPSFIARGDKIRVDTATGEYLERAKG